MYSVCLSFPLAQIKIHVSHNSVVRPIPGSKTITIIANSCLKLTPTKHRPFPAFYLFYFVNFSSILTPIQVIQMGPCSRGQKLSPNPLRVADFDDWVPFKLEFANWNADYKMRRPRK